MLQAIFFLFLLPQILYCCRVNIWNPFSANQHFAALILARDGSKSIPFKNLALVGEDTLLGRSLNAIKGSNSFDSVWVSTDSEKIAQFAIDAEVNVHLNTGENFEDTSTSLSAVQYFLKYHQEIDVLGLVQCTSPFIKSRYLKRGETVLRSGEECAFSVIKNIKLHWIRNKDDIFPLNFDPKRRPRRQDIFNQFTENGMFYFTKRKLLLDGYFQSPR